MRIAVVIVLLAANVGLADDTPDINRIIPSDGTVEIRDIRRAERRLTNLVFGNRMNVTSTLGESEKAFRHFKLSRIDGPKGHFVKLVSPSVGGYTEITATKLVLGCDGEDQVIATADATHVILQIGNIKMQVTETEIELETSKLRLTGEDVSHHRYVVPNEHSESAAESSESLPSATDAAPNGE